MAGRTMAATSDPVELHRRHWAEGIDLDVVALTIALHRATDALNLVVRDIWTRHQLTPAEFDVLATLRRSPAPCQLTPSQIQSSLAITSGGLTKVMAALEARALVSRSINEDDQRVRPVRLSTAGKRVVEKAMADLMALMAPRLHGLLTRSDMTAMTRLLTHIAEGYEGKGRRQRGTDAR